jgi:hypothetical protein
MNGKVCIKCRGTYPPTTEYFYRSNRVKGGLMGTCKRCLREYRTLHKEYRKKYAREYYEKNRREIMGKTKEYYKNNAEVRKRKEKERKLLHKEEIRDKNREYCRRPDRKEHLRLYSRNRRRDNIGFKILGNLRNAVNRVLKYHSAKKMGHTLELVGCTIKELIRHIESRFLPGMTWGNYNRDGWWIDHIIPCISFDLTKIEEQLKCFHYTNLQPLWWRDNITKNSWYNGVLIRKPKG